MDDATDTEKGSFKTSKEIDCETSMTYGGIGPKLALLCLPYIILSIVVMIKYPEFFDLRFLDNAAFKVLGYVWLGLGLILHSGLILTFAMVLYIGFKISIHGENIALRRAFGEEFEVYRKSVNEIFPFPRYLLKSK